MLGVNRAQRRALAVANRAWPETLVEVPPEQWPTTMRNPGLERVFRSRGFLVQQFAPMPDGVVRLSVNRTEFSATTGCWVDGITWDELQQLKAEAGFADRWAVELYPTDAEIVNVGNLRHLWLLPEPPSFGWRQ